MRRIEGLSDVIDAYRVLLVDAYGTLHDGRVTLPFVIEAMQRARSAGRIVVVVTNSPQRVAGMVTRLANVGFPQAGYDHIACSGELTWRDLDDRNRRGLRKVHFILQGTGVAWLGDVPNPMVGLDEAEIVVAAGMPHPTEAEAQGSPLVAALAAAQTRGVPMLVADSDFVYPERGFNRLGPGWLARFYAGLGGAVTEYGKPFDPIYDEALALAGGAAPHEVLMIGDNLATDILGAARRGFASLLVQESGVHAGLDMAALAAEASRAGAAPTFFSQHLRW
jgi:HAD superfamily hydrolase (TIGR01459 family)